MAQEGAILDTIETSVTVRALPTAVPTSIELDVSQLELGDTLHISDLPEVEGVTYVGDPEHTLVTVLAPRVEEEPVAPAEGAEGEEGEEGEEGADGERAAEAEDER